MQFPYLADRRSVTDAEDLIARFGAAAEHEAASRASRSRTVGNHIHYWDDTGFEAEGTFVSDDELHHAGMILLRQR